MSVLTSQADEIYEQIRTISAIIDRSTVKYGNRLYESRGSNSSTGAIPLIISSSSRLPPSLIPRVPVEILDTVFRYSDTAELTQILQTNKALHSVALRLLYRSLDLSKPIESVKCLRTLLNNPKLALYTREIDVSWSTTIANPTRNLYDLLHAALRNMRNLTSLSIELAKSHRCMWILDGCTFSLSSFSTSFPCTAPLAQFLDGQKNLTDLTLRGYNSDIIEALPATSVSAYLNPAASGSFTLKPDSLPKLSQLRAIHAGPEVVGSVIKGRPVTQVSIPIYADSAGKALDALEQSEKPLQRLNIISFDPKAPEYLLSEVARRFRHLEALHVVILLANCTEQMLEESAPLLANFDRLQYLTFMAATPTDQPYVGNEQAIAAMWHKTCPTLKTIILPRGKVWFHEKASSRWACLEDADSP